ncbi:F-box protein CPR1-like [Arachis hypogaea]|uniref:F-box protein CPR1-like n=1 Tax=Arachis hypogaea TaxID=3818 RepID=UPI003B20D003
MEKKSIHDILPVEFIHRIFLRVPAKHLTRLRCVSKLWYSLISDPHFAEMHFHHSPASTNAYFFIEKGIVTYLVDLEALFSDNNDALQDDYLIVVACHDKHDEIHFNCLSLRTNSFIYHDAGSLKHLRFDSRLSCRLFLNGAIHWVSFNLKDYRYAIIIFDLKERTFSMLSVPEQLVSISYSDPGLALLGGCLAFYYRNDDYCNTDIWVMKEYKVHSSWTLYQIPCQDSQPLCLSSNGDIIGKDYDIDNIGFFIYNVRGDLLKHFKNLSFEAATVYTESLLPLPSDIKDKDNRPSGMV